jgi:hypothetical protein
MAASDLEPDFTVQEAARWIVETPREQRPGAVVVEIMARFPLNTVGAVAAIRLANAIRSGGANVAS